MGPNKNKYWLSNFAGHIQNGTSVSHHSQRFLLSPSHLHNISVLLGRAFFKPQTFVCYFHYLFIYYYYLLWFISFLLSFKKVRQSQFRRERGKEFQVYRKLEKNNTKELWLWDRNHLLTSPFPKDSELSYKLNRDCSSVNYSDVNYGEMQSGCGCPTTAQFEDCWRMLPQTQVQQGKAEHINCSEFQKPVSVKSAVEHAVAISVFYLCRIIY